MLVYVVPCVCDIDQVELTVSMATATHVRMLFVDCKYLFVCCCFVFGLCLFKIKLLLLLLLLLLVQLADT